MSVLYIGDWQGFYGTAYGVMVGAKIAMFLMLLALGGMNFLLVERLRAQPATLDRRGCKRFAEVEIGIGFAIFFAAASLTSVPPAVDLTQDRVTLVRDRRAQHAAMAALRLPDHDALALPALQAKLDAEAAQHDAAPQPAFVPGSGELPPRNAADIAWSEYNHHWSGIVRPGDRGAGAAEPGRAALGAPLAAAVPGPGRVSVPALRSRRSGRSATSGFFESLRDVEVLQHRVFVVLIVAFALFEWRVAHAAASTIRRRLWYFRCSAPAAARCC